MDGQENRNLKKVMVSYEVIEKVAKFSALEVKGVEELTSEDTIFDKLFLKKKRTVNILRCGDVFEITISIAVQYGNKISSVVEKVQNNVKTAIQSMIGITVCKVNVNVEEIIFDELKY